MATRARKRRWPLIVAASVVVLGLLGAAAVIPGSPLREGIATVTKWRECWITPADESTPNRVAGFGDSITAGHGDAALHVGANDSYFQVLACHSDSLSYGGTFAVWHQTAAEILGRIDDVVAASPSTVLIVAGTNDVQVGTEAEAIEALSQMKRTFDNAGIRPVFGLVPPSTDWPAETVAYNTMIQSWASTNDAEVIDFWSPLAKPDGTWRDGLTSDGIHPSKAGAAIMAETAQRYVEQAIDSKGESE